MVFAGIAPRLAMPSQSAFPKFPSSRDRAQVIPPQLGKTAGCRIQSAAYIIDLRTQHHHHHHHQLPFAKPRVKRHNVGAFGVGGPRLFNHGGPAISNYFFGVNKTSALYLNNRGTI